MHIYYKKPVIPYNVLYLVFRAVIFTVGHFRELATSHEGRDRWEKKNPTKFDFVPNDLVD
jgi:hypothetical protein